MNQRNVRSTVFRLVISVALTVSAIYATAAKAEVLLAQTRTAASLIGGATYTLDFNGAGAGGTTFNFVTDAPNTRVVFMFNAECVVHGNAYQWINIDIRVNPAGAAGEYSVSPTNGDNALCSGNATNSSALGSGDGWVSASTIGYATLTNAGSHTVRVRVDGNGTASRLDDFSLIVMD